MGKPAGLRCRRWRGVTLQRGVRPWGRTRWSAPTLGMVRLHGGQWVKGTKAGRNAGRRQECLPHEEAAPQEQPVAKRDRNAIRRQDWRRGTQDCVLHLKAGVASKTACSTLRLRGPLSPSSGAPLSLFRSPCLVDLRVEAFPVRFPAPSIGRTAQERSNRGPYGGAARYLTGT